MPLDFSKFVKEIVNPLHFPSKEKRLLKQLRFSGGTYSDFANILSEVPEFEKSLLEAANAMFESKLKEPLSVASVALSMIGFIPARNFLTASLLTNSSTKILPNHPDLSKVLRYSLEGESQGGEHSGEYFLAGFVFDLITSVLVPPALATSKGGYSYLNNIWKHGLSVTKIAIQLSKKIAPEISLERDLILDGMLHDIGKVAYDLLAPELDKTTGKTPPLSETRWLEESKVFSIPHDALGFLMLSRLGFLEDTSWVVLFHHQPFLAENRGSSIYARTMLIWLADHLVRYREHHRSSKMSDRILDNWYQASKSAFGKCASNTFKDSLKGIQL